MKISQTSLLSDEQLKEFTNIGRLLARLRVARRIKQSEAALRAGLSLNTVYRLEQGDPGLAMGQLLRYLHALAPHSTLLDLLTEKDPTLKAFEVSQKKQRVRGLTATERQALDF